MHTSLLEGECVCECVRAKCNIIIHQRHSHMGPSQSRGFWLHAPQRTRLSDLGNQNLSLVVKPSDTVQRLKQRVTLVEPVPFPEQDNSCLVAFWAFFGILHGTFSKRFNCNM